MNWFRGERPPDNAPELNPHASPERETLPLEKRDPLLGLQRLAGNQAVQKLLQRAHGDPMPEGERKELEAAFGQDLGDIRIHRDQEAADLSSAVDASAFTTGRDIYFAPGAYNSPTLAHEVSHVIQQSQAASSLPAEDASLEQQAGSASSAAMSGRMAEISPGASAPGLQRQPAPGAETPSVGIFPTDTLTVDGFEIDKSALNGAQKQKLDEFAKLHASDPSEELQERLRAIDRAVREAQRAERVKGTSIADVTGWVLRRAAERIGLPQWAQDRAESLGRDLPAMGARAVIDQIATEKNIDPATRDALKALVDALARTKVP